MNTIVISPYSRQLREPKEKEINPKNFPYWDTVINLLKDEFNIVQVGIDGEKKLNHCEHKFNLSFEELKILLKDCHTWISVDNMINHLGSYVGKRGVVIFGKSDPKIFGYDENINLLKSTKYLRQFQFDVWESERFDAESFVTAQRVVEAVKQI